ncbi:MULTISPECIES: hypothetical protein [unclassified Luteococcus]|uniref:hypothetical protein n=1 Tax=unclassified Luteococcus TaxID=2639923 RepID=UPI00313C298D
MSDASTAQLQELVADLSQRLTALEAEVASLKANQQIPEDVMVAISAAVSAYLGHNAKVKAVHLRNRSNWATETRGRAHFRAV